MQPIHTMIATAAEAWRITPDEATKLLSLPRHKCVRLNSLKARKSTLQSLRKDGIELVPLEWASGCYWVAKGYEKLSTHPCLANGEIFLQNAASFLPVLALDPQPTDAILDVAAAPGGKSSHIASITKNKASLVANDTSRDRFFKMRTIFEQLGVDAELTLHDGRNARKVFADRQFDKILLDAPCSGEAAIDPSISRTFETWSASKVKRLSRLQEQLLVASFDCLRVGGTLVYSTCTINPTENELVVARLLRRRPAELQTINTHPDDARPGLTAWAGKVLPPQLEQCKRLLPSDRHEAFFVAKISKTRESTDESYYT